MRAAALLALVLVVGGCLGATSEPAALQSALGPVSVEGAKLLTQNETTITFEWAGTALRSTVPGINLGAAAQVTRVSLPPAQHVRLLATLAWAGSADLDLYISDPEGATQCSAASDAPSPEVCSALVWQPHDKASEWEVMVVPFSAPEDTPYTVTLVVESIIPPDIGFDISTLTRPTLEALPKTVEYVAASFDGAMLYTETYLPEGPGPWPTIFVLSPYYSHGYPAAGLGADPESVMRSYYVPRGYAVVLGDVRGTGNSEGCYEMMGDAERQDAYDLVEAIAAQPWSDGRVGMWGVSYVGTTPHMAAVMDPPHLSTIVTVAGVTSQWRNMYLNGVPIQGRSYPTGYWASEGLPPPGDIERGSAWALNVGEGYCTDSEGPTHVAPGTYEKGVYDAYWLERNQTVLVENVRIPVFYAQGFADRLVTPEEALDWFNALPSPKKAFLHQGVHQLPPRADYSVAVHAWFDHWLKGIDNGIETSNVVEVLTNDGTIRRGDSWPPLNASRLRLHPTPDGELTVEPPAGATLTYVADNGRAIAPPQGVASPLDALTASAGAPTSFSFATGSLDAPVHMAGVPWANLVASSSAQNTYFFLSIYDINGEEWNEVTEGWMNAHLREGFDRSAPLTPGATYTFGFKFMPDEYVFAAGHRIGLRILGHDPRANPTDMPAAQNTVELGKAGSWIELPYLEKPDVRPRPADL